MSCGSKWRGWSSSSRHRSSSSSNDTFSTLLRVPLVAATAAREVSPGPPLASLQRENQACGYPKQAFAARALDHPRHRLRAGRSRQPSAGLLRRTLPFCSSHPFHASHAVRRATAIPPTRTARRPGAAHRPSSTRRTSYWRCSASPSASGKMGRSARRGGGRIRRRFSRGQSRPRRPRISIPKPPPVQCPSPKGRQRADFSDLPPLRNTRGCRGERGRRIVPWTWR